MAAKQKVTYVLIKLINFNISVSFLTFNYRHSVIRRKKNRNHVTVASLIDFLVPSDSDVRVDAIWNEKRNEKSGS